MPADADAVICNADDDTLFLALCLDVNGHFRSRLYALFPFFFESVYGVADEVEDYLLHFIEVAPDWQLFGAAMEGELY